MLVSQVRKLERPSKVAALRSALIHISCSKSSASSRRLTLRSAKLKSPGLSAAMVWLEINSAEAPKVEAVDMRAFLSRVGCTHASVPGAAGFVQGRRPLFRTAADEHQSSLRASR
jgi:hypothetical protein